MRSHLRMDTKGDIVIQCIIIYRQVKIGRHKDHDGLWEPLKCGRAETHHPCPTIKLMAGQNMSIQTSFPLVAVQQFLLAAFAALSWRTSIHLGTNPLQGIARVGPNPAFHVAWLQPWVCNCKHGAESHGEFLGLGSGTRGPWSSRGPVLQAPDDICTCQSNGSAEPGYILGQHIPAQKQHLFVA